MKRILPILCLILLAACGERSEVQRLMAEADSLVAACPDSALAMLERIDTTGLRRAERMHLELMRGKAITRAGNTITTDSVARKVAAYYDRWPHRDPNRRMLAHYYLGMAYRDMGSAIRALDEFQTAASVADTASARCDLPTLMRVHSQMALVFKNQRLDSLENIENHVAEALCWKIGDTLSALIFEQYYCTNLFLYEKYEESLVETEYLYKRFMEAGYPDNGALACINAVKSAIALGDYPTAKKYLDIYETSLYLKENLREVRGGISPLYINKAFYNLGIHELDSAEYYFRKSIENRVALAGIELSSYDGLKQVFELRHEPDSALKYATLYSIVNRRHYDQSKSDALVHVKSLYDYGVEQKIANEEKTKSGRRGIIIVILMMAVLAAIVTLLILIYQKLRKERVYSHLRIQHIRLQSDLSVAKGQLAAIQRQKEEIEKSLTEQNTETESILQAQILKDEAEISNLNAHIETLQKTLAEWEGKQQNNYPNIQPTSDTVLPAHHNESYESAKKGMYTLLTKHQDESERAAVWEIFTAESEKAYPITTCLLKNTRNLNPDEYRVALLVIAEFKPKIIEGLMNRASGYATNARKRLLEKVFRKKGKADEFDTRILNFKYKNEARQFSVSF